MHYLDLLVQPAELQPGPGHGLLAFLHEHSRVEHFHLVHLQPLSENMTRSLMLWIFSSESHSVRSTSLSSFHPKLVKGSNCMLLLEALHQLLMTQLDLSSASLEGIS